MVQSADGRTLAYRVEPEERLLAWATGAEATRTRIRQPPFGETEPGPHRRVPGDC
jgi:hypothetical protein